MKKSISSKNTSIRREEELVYHFRELLSVDSDLKWTDFQESSPNHLLDGQVCLQLDGRTLDFTLEFKLKPGIPDLEKILSRGSLSKILLVAPNLTQRVIQFCKEHRLSCIDLNGRAWLRADGLLVDRKALPGRSFKYELEPQNIFEGKSERLVRSLLTDRDKVWTQAELVKRTRASSGMVSRLVQYFVAQAYLKKLSPREYRLNDFNGLLDEWCAADNLQKRCTTSYYAGPIGSLEQVTEKLKQWAERESVPLAFTQWLGAYQRCPYTEPAICSAYVKRLPETATLESLGLRPVEEGGKVWLHVPKDEGVFLEAESHSNHKLTLVSDAQIYIDLKKTGLRGPDAAQALRDWKGFCRK